MSNIELLSPAGDFECLVSAVQNGANAVYFGLEKFNARVNNENFKEEELIKAIKYAKLRNVKTHLTLNILIKNNEFEEALKLVEFAYNAGIDAIIVQDLGLAKKIMELFPKLEVHASTQMTIYNLDGAKEIEKLGYSRCVLARELSIEEIKNICKNTNIEIEVFIHGALCICYSGQCLMSSLIGGRSGNRGKCAGTCRLPYSLLKDGEEQERGYLLSSKDVCTLDILPELIEAGVKSFKIEGRMKSKEYVGIVTSIYRKYIDLAESNKEYIVDEEDREKLMQIFNRGRFSTGYLKGKLGKKMMYTKRPNHMGTLLGEVISYNPNKGHVKIKLSKDLDLGDSIAIADVSCKISELMQENNNIKTAKVNQIVTIGRIKGKIKPKDKVYKTVSIKLNQDIDQKISKENIKRKINCSIELRKNEVIKLELQDIATNISVKVAGNYTIQKADNTGITSKRVEEQLSKTGNTIFKIENINIKMDDNIIISISSLNEIRRRGLEELEQRLLESFKREQINLKLDFKEQSIVQKNDVKVTLCLNKINEEIDYAKLTNVDNVYISFKYFLDENVKENIENISNNFSTYVMLPTVTKSNYEELIYNNLPKIAEKVEGIVVSNLSQIYEIEKLGIKGKKIVANYTMNIENNFTVEELKKLGVCKYIVPPEAEKDTIQGLTRNIEKETIVYGRTLLMTTEYCTIGTLKNCPAMCQKGKYTLKDRIGFEFPIYTDRVNCNNLIYNSKITSISYKDLDTDSIRIDILEETQEKIQEIIDIQKRGERLEGQVYTNGNLNREI
ncbi:MAG: DUF3656 domain-containing protein [Clostridia bacterium]